MIRLLSSRTRICNKSQRLSLLLSRNTLLVPTFKPAPLQFYLFASFTPVMSEESTFYSLKAELPSGKAYDFADLKGKTVLIVNTASKCGFTPQYTALQKLYEEYKEQNFEIIGFPCNQFGGQEPEDDGAIQEYCTINHGVTFPLMKKSDVNGDNTNEVFKWLKAEKSGLLGLSRIKWNFEKFLIDKNGKVVERWASPTTPEAIGDQVAKIV